MALGSDVVSLGDPNKSFYSVAPMSMTTKWQTIIDAGGAVIQDAASITNPTTEITSSTRHMFRRYGRGTFLMLRLAYAAALTVGTSPVVKVFGRTSSTDVWQLLKTEGGSLTGTLTAAATDVTDGTYKYTTCDVLATTWDCLGCELFLVGVETVLAGVGTTSTAFIQGKLL